MFIFDTLMELLDIRLKILHKCFKKITQISHIKKTQHSSAKNK